MTQLIGRKLGMTQIFTEAGIRIPVTVVEVPENIVLFERTLERDGYRAIQVGAIDKRAKNSNKSELGHIATVTEPKGDAEKALEATVRKGSKEAAKVIRSAAGKGDEAEAEVAKKADDLRGENKSSRKELRQMKKDRLAKVTPKRVLREIRLDEKEEAPAVGSELPFAELFSEGEYIDVEGTSKGRGFTGAIKRWGFKRQGMSHGVEKVHRQVGSSGPGTTPARIRKGLKRPGQHGNAKNTARNLQIVKIQENQRLLLIKGAIPGANGGVVIVKKNKYKRTGVATAE